MSSLRRVVTTVGIMLAILVLSPLSSAHADSLQECFDKTAGPDGEPPMCSDVDGGFDDSMAGDGIPGGFVALIVIAVLVGVAITVWKVVTARTLAAQSGMDPNLATQMTLLTEDGLNSTYLAANLRPTSEPAAQTPATPAMSSAQRLIELKGLLDADLITQAEFDQRRAAIITSL